MPFPEGVPSVPVRYSITSPVDGGPGEDGRMPRWRGLVITQL
ncbi:hypothetical protein [Streptomyces sp. DH8]|nr:hypothetical protein [Streptomyces sp. DH8]